MPDAGRAPAGAMAPAPLPLPFCVATWPPGRPSRPGANWRAAALAAAWAMARGSPLPRVRRRG
jgi:hypothetical protein